MVPTPGDERKLYKGVGIRSKSAGFKMKMLLKSTGLLFEKAHFAYEDAHYVFQVLENFREVKLFAVFT